MKRAVLLAVIAGLVCGTGAWAGGEGEGAAGERVHVTAYWTDGVPPPKGRMLEYINDKFNMDFEIIVQPIAEYAQKLQLDMASGDLADLIQVRGPTTGGARIVRLLIDGGMVQDLTPMLVDYPNLTAYLAQPEASRFSLWDGNNYVVPKRYFHHTTGFYYRKDLLDKYNQPIPETVEQFGEVLKVVHEGEGIPGYVSFGLYFGNHYFFGAHTDIGMDHPAWKWKDGRYVDLSISDEWKEGLRIIRQFYADGVLDPEFVILTDFGKFREKFTTGKGRSDPGSRRSQLLLRRDGWVDREEHSGSRRIRRLPAHGIGRPAQQPSGVPVRHGRYARFDHCRPSGSDSCAVGFSVFRGG